MIKPDIIELYNNLDMLAMYNVAKLQILSAVEFLNGIGEEATSEAVAVLTGRSVESVCHLAARYERAGLLKRQLLKRKNRLVKGRIYKYKIAKKGTD